jgi:hypothetical protein
VISAQAGSSPGKFILGRQTEQFKGACSGMIQVNANPQLTVVEVTDPQRIARHRLQDERHERNLQWLEAHWGDLSRARGRYVAVANERAFVADTAELAWEWARTEHPEDDGAVVMFVPQEKSWRVYANRR